MRLSPLVRRVAAAVAGVFGVGAAGCGSGAGGTQAPMDASVGGNDASHPDVPADVSGAVDGPADGGGFEPPPLPYFFGTCTSFGAASLVPTDRGALLYGLTVLATGLPKTVGLEVDATNAYLVTSAAILRLQLSGAAGGAAPVMMVSGAAPVATAIDADSIFWVDSGVAGQTTILRAPLTATGWTATAGGGGGQTATMLASQAGMAGPFTVGGGYVYFANGKVVSRVPTAGGAVQMVSTTIEARGLAAATDALYFTEFSDETIQRVVLTGTLPAMPAFFKLAYAVPTAIALNGGDLYFDDWFGGVEYLPIASPTTGKRFSAGCGGAFAAACEYRLRAAARGAIWASEPRDCGSIGRVNPDGSEMMAGGLAPIGGIAGTSTHAYATTSLGELLRWTL